MVRGVPAHVDGRMIEIAQGAGGEVIHPDRMWHYTEGIRNWAPIWPEHGIRILPGPSSLWLDATGNRLPVPLFPGFDTLGTLAHIGTTGHEHTWFVLTQKIIEKEFALSGSEQNPDITGKSIRELLQDHASAPARRAGRGLQAPRPGLRRRERPGHADRRHEPPDRDAAAGPGDGSRRGRRRATASWTTRSPRTSRSPPSTAPAATCADRITRVAAPHKLLDPAAGPLIAVKLHILTRKTLGGLHTDLEGRVLRSDGEPLPGLYAAGEAAGFGGGGMHGYRALEGTFLGGCLFSGRVAGTGTGISGRRCQS